MKKPRKSGAPAKRPRVSGSLAPGQKISMQRPAGSALTFWLMWFSGKALAALRRIRDIRPRRRWAAYPILAVCALFVYDGVERQWGFYRAGRLVCAEPYQVLAIRDECARVGCYTKAGLLKYEYEPVGRISDFCRWQKPTIEDRAVIIAKSLLDTQPEFVEWDGWSVMLEPPSEIDLEQAEEPLVIAYEARER